MDERIIEGFGSVFVFVAKIFMFRYTLLGGECGEDAMILSQNLIPGMAQKV
jgi:hypothetical protein